jgi:hypothetical protein
MSIVDYSASTSAIGHVTASAGQPGYHRLGVVRRLQGISRRTWARRMNMELSEVRRQEDQGSDLPLSAIHEWQKVLEVPMAELLVETDDTLSRPLMQRAQLLRLMKTALALQEEADSGPARQLTEALIQKLVEIMPELENVTAWHAVGKRRRLNDVGVAALRGLTIFSPRELSDELFVESSE